MLKKYFFKI